MAMRDRSRSHVSFVSYLFLVTTLRYAASDNFNYLRGCLTLLPSAFSWAPGRDEGDFSKWQTIWNFLKAYILALLLPMPY